ncbi:MAG: alpha/beta fold hydrolase [Alphaproteobacteria bacterium]
MTIEFALKKMDLPSGSIDYLSAGTGHDVIYLHPASGMRISPALERLGDRFRVWAPIIPGFDGTDRHEGLSSIRDLAELLSAFIENGPGRACDIVGSSLGGWLGAWFAVEYPDQVEQLVLAAPAGFRAMDAPPLSFEPEIMRKQLYAHPERVPPDGKTPEMRKANGETVAYYGLGVSCDADLQDRVSDIACQTLILHGTLDVRVPESGVQFLKARIPRSQLVYVYDAAHSLEVDQPERVGDLIVDFLLRGEAFIVKQKPVAGAAAEG